MEVLRVDVGRSSMNSIEVNEPPVESRRIRFTRGRLLSGGRRALANLYIELGLGALNGRVSRARCSS